MNVDEAIEILQYGIDNATASRATIHVTRLRQAIAVLRTHIAGKVDDAMVERFGHDYFNWWDRMPESSREIYRVQIQSALIAALGVEG